MGGDHRPADQRSPSPVLGDVAEHLVLDLVPLARPGREVAHRDPQAELGGQVLHLIVRQKVPRRNASIDAFPLASFG